MKDSEGRVGNSHYCRVVTPRPITYKTLKKRVISPFRTRLPHAEVLLGQFLFKPFRERLVSSQSAICEYLLRGDGTPSSRATFYLSSV